MLYAKLHMLLCWLAIRAAIAPDPTSACHMELLPSFPAVLADTQALLDPPPGCHSVPQTYPHLHSHLVQVDDGAVVLVLAHVEVPHAHLAEVTRVVIVKHDPARG